MNWYFRKFCILCIAFLTWMPAASAQTEVLVYADGATEPVRLKIVQVVGRGASGTVFLVDDGSKKFVIKLLNPLQTEQALLTAAARNVPTALRCFYGAFAT